MDDEARGADPIEAALDGLFEKVAVFFSAAAAHAARVPENFACARGCAGCCRSGLSVTPLEARRLAAAVDALSDEARAALRARLATPRESCVFLGDDLTCTVYEARPLVCRTQGLALRYPRGFVPAELVIARTRDAEADDVVWCPLNHREWAPDAAHVLDAERVDAMLALLHRHAGLDPLARIAMDELADAVTGSTRAEPAHDDTTC